MRLSWLFLAVALHASAADLWVSPTGSDDNDGSRDRPFATVQAALNRDPAAHVYIAPGSYTLSAPLTLTAANSGAVLEATGPGSAVFSGGRRITGFTRADNGLWRATTDLRFEQLWVNGSRATRARTPNEYWLYVRRPFGYGTDPATGQMADLSRRAFTGYAADLAALGRLSPAELRQVEVMAWHSWAISRHKVASIENADTLFFTGPSQYPFNNFGPSQRYHLENYFEALDAPGEWFLALDGTLWYKPRDGEDMTTAEVIAPAVSQLLVINGAQHVTLRGLRFEYSGYALPASGVPDTQSAAFLDAAVMLDNVRDVHLEDLQVAHTGQYGIWFRRNCRESYLERSLIEDLGAGGVRIGETVGVNESTITQSIVVDNNIIRDGGYVFPSGVGVFVGNSAWNRVTHNEIAGFLYSGVSVGWVWGYGNSPAVGNNIDFNHIHHLGFGLLSDMGGIYTLGPSPGTTLRGNRIHDILSYDLYGRGGWGLYNDEGSSNILVENNLVYRTKTGSYHQHYGRENVIRNNVFAFNTDAQLQLSRAEPHQSISFTNNIVLWDGGPLLYNAAWKTANVDMHSNVYWDLSGGAPRFLDLTFEQWRALGRDAGSLWRDPQLHLTDDGYQIADTSPALGVGFVPFDASQAGVYGSDEWRSRAAEFAFTRPMRTPPAPPPAPALEFLDTFEATPVGGAPAFATLSVENKGDFIRVATDAAFKGQRSLKVQDAPGLTQAYNPHFYYRPGHKNGVATLRFALRAEPNALLYHEWRDSASPYRTGPSLTIQNNRLRINNQDQLDLPPNQWAEFEITCGVGEESTGTWDLKVTPAGQPARTFRFPNRNSDWRALEWLGFVGNDNRAVAFWLDDIELRSATPSVP